MAGWAALSRGPRRSVKRILKIAYGVAETGQAAAEFIFNIALLEFFVVAVGLRPELAALAIALGSIWDALCDPLMGALVDRTRQLRRRYLPYMIAGAWLVAAALLLTFHPPTMSGQAGKFAHMLFCCLFFNTAMSILSVPHGAMSAVLTEDRHERTELFGWRLLFGNLGLLAGVLLPVVLTAWLQADVKTAEGLMASRGWLSYWLAGIVLIGTGCTWWGFRQHLFPPANTTTTQVPLWQKLRSLARNPVYRGLLLAFLAVSIARTINTSVALFYYKITLGLDERTIFLHILCLFIVVIWISIPLWLSLARRFGKKYPAFAGLGLLGLMTSIVYPLFPPGEVTPPMFAAVLGGLLVGCIILFESILVDAIDWGELKSGRREEGLYFGFWKMATKLARSLGLAITALVLALIGFEQAQTQPGLSAQRGLAWLFGPGVGFFFLLGAAAFYWLPYSDFRHQRVQTLLRRKRKKVTEPLSDSDKS